VIATLSVVVAFEKISPFGPVGARIGGVVLMVAAVWMLVR
jgi:predicted metal-binding membrane protein